MYSTWFIPLRKDEISGVVEIDMNEKKTRNHLPRQKRSTIRKELEEREIKLSHR